MSLEGGNQDPGDPGGKGGGKDFFPSRRGGLTLDDTMGIIIKG